MAPRTAETLAWVLIYSGLLLAVLGWFVQRDDPTLGWILVAVGLADAAAGVVLVWWRSRMPDRPAPDAGRTKEPR